MNEQNIKYQNQVETNIALVDQLQTQAVIKENLQRVIHDYQETTADLEKRIGLNDYEVLQDQIKELQDANDTL
jgi:hypothetical protein